MLQESRREGLAELAEVADSAEAREVAKVALHRGHTLGSLAREFNVRFGKKLIAINVSRYLSAKRLGEETRARFCQVLVLDPEHLILAGQPLSAARVLHWREQVVKDFEFDGPRFAAGTRAKVDNAFETDYSIAASALRDYALADYRHRAGLSENAGTFGHGVTQIAPGWIGTLAQLAFVDGLRPIVDLRELHQSRIPNEDALANLYRTLIGLLSHDVTLSLVALARTLFAREGHDVTAMDAYLKNAIRKMQAPQR